MIATAISREYDGTGGNYQRVGDAFLIMFKVNATWVPMGNAPLLKDDINGSVMGLK